MDGHDSPMSAPSASPGSVVSPPAGSRFRWPWAGPSESSEGGGGRAQPFAAEVLIKGWQVVGGKSFDDSAKVGAYVGECVRRRTGEGRRGVWTRLTVVYDIEITLRNGSHVSILRRYTEFVRLRDALRKAYPVSPRRCIGGCE